jgi:hypothetical protein
MIKDPVTITSIGWRIFVEKNVQKLIVVKQEFLILKMKNMEFFVRSTKNLI